MKLEQSFTVDAPPERVWEALVDVERVAPCLPGAQIIGHEGDTYHGTFSVKLGPTTAAYNGSLKMEQLDEAGRVAVMSARGTDKRGQGGASATIRSTIVEESGATRVDVVTDFTITGRLARFGRGGMIQDVSNRLMRDFASCLQSTIGAEPADAVPSGPGEGQAPAAGESAAPVGGVEGEAAITTGPAAGQPPVDTPPTAEPPSAPPPPAAAPAPVAPPPPAPPRPQAQPARPVSAFALLRSVLWERIKRLFGRGSR